MFSNLFSALTLAAVLGPCAVLAQDAAATCDAAGPSTYFCSGDSFSKLDLGQRDGVSFWMHNTGFLSKILVEDTGGTQVTQSQIENRILAIVSEQADQLGRDFAFSDLSADTVAGVPFGTFSYNLQNDKVDSTVLHSYVALKGRVLQVISQIARKSASSEKEALQQAHAAALRAVKLTDPSTDA